MTAVLPRLAVLIDADNVPPETIDSLFPTIQNIGDPAVKEIYGNVACTSSEKWIEVSIRHALSTGRRALQSKGRNATDIEMVIGAMDLLASNNVQGFCIVSSDRDFTALAIRLRAGGKLVYGFGESKTADSFRRACHEFRIIPAPAPKKSAAPGVPGPLPIKHAIGLLKEAFEKTAIDGWATLTAVAQYLKLNKPDFAAKNYGSANLKKLVKKCGQFDLEVRDGVDAFRPAIAKIVLKLVTPAQASRN